MVNEILLREFNLFQKFSERIGDDKRLLEHLKLPIQRLNDYQLLLKVRFIIIFFFEVAFNRT